MGALTRTVNHRSAYLLGKFNSPIKSFWQDVRKNVFIISATTALVWLSISPLLQSFFHAETILPFILFTPVWVISALAAVDGGFLNGNLKFSTLALIVLVESVSKFLITIMLVNFGLQDWIYAAIPMSMSLSFFVGWVSAAKIAPKKMVKKPVKKVVKR
jgi:O-antigen/teichoic acid export membrane protein